MVIYSHKDYIYRQKYKAIDGMEVEMKIKLSDSELKLMNVLWEEEKLYASQLVAIMKERYDWSRTTTYTVIKYCINKGAIIREEPHFLCEAAVKKDKIQAMHITELIQKLFDNSTEKFLSAFLTNRKFNSEEIDELKELVNRLEEKDGDHS